MKILLVDDHVIVRSGLRNLLTSVSDTQISEAATGRDALLRLRQDRPDLVLLDLNLPGIGGLELLRRMLLEDKAARILVLSMHAEPLYAARAMELGARGYLSKNASADELLTAVRRVTEGGRYIENEIAQELALQTVSPGHGLQDLTERDLEIMRLMAEGMSLAEIADALGIGYKTVGQRVQSHQGQARRDTDERTGSARDDAGGCLTSGGSAAFLPACAHLDLALELERPLAIAPQTNPRIVVVHPGATLGFFDLPIGIAAGVHHPCGDNLRLHRLRHDLPSGLRVGAALVRQHMGWCFRTQDQRRLVHFQPVGDRSGLGCCLRDGAACDDGGQSQGQSDLAVSHAVPPSTLRR